MTVNQDIFDREVDHAAMVRFYEEKLNRDIDAIYKTHRSRLHDIVSRGGNTRPLLDKVEKQVARAHRNLYNGMSKEMQAFIASEADFNVDSLDKSVGNFYKVKSPSRTQLRNLVLSRPIRDNRILSKHFSSIATGEQLRLERIIKQGIRDGLPYNKIANKVITGGTTKISALQAKALVRTAITGYASEASDRVYMENEDVLKGYQYVATLDSRTTPICSSLDGRVFPIGRASDPRPPQHWNCRSTTVPVVDDIDNLEEKANVRTGKLSPRQRASVNGQVAASETYNSWLLRQGRDVQLRHFGNDQDRLDLFLGGNLTLDKFVNKAGKWVSLATLIRINAYETERINPGLASHRIICRSPCKEFNSEDDFVIPLGDKLENFYDGPDATALTHQLQDWALYHSRDGVFQLVDYRGIAISSKARHRGNITSDPENTRWDPLIQDEVHASYMPYSKRVLDDELKRIRESKDLTDVDKDFLENRFYGYLQHRVSGNQAATILRVVGDAFAHKRRNPDFNISNFDKTLVQFGRANQYGRVKDIAKKLESDARKNIKELNKLENTQLQSGILGNVDLDDIIRDAPAARKRLAAFKLDDDLVDIDDIDLKGITSKPITKASVNDAILNTLKLKQLQGERAMVSIGKNIAKQNKLFPDSNGTVAQHQRIGLRVVESLQRRGKLDILVLSTRNRWYDELHNNGKGGWRFEQVTAMDWKNDGIRRFLNDQEIDNIRFRMGNNGYSVKTGSNFYVDADGIPTNQLIRTSNLNDRLSVPSSGLSKALNDKQSVEWKADDFIVAMDKLFARDFDGNTIRQAFLDRNDHNTLNVARYWLRKDENVSFQYRAHESNRMQAIGYWTPHSGEFWRSSFKTPTRKPLTEGGWLELQNRLAVLRDKTEFNTREKRIEWFEQNKQRIYDFGAIVDNLSDSSRSAGPAIKKLIADPMFKTINGLDGAEQLLFMRYSREVYRIGQASKSAKKQGSVPFSLTERIHRYETDLPAELDQAESGLAMMMSTSRNLDGMKKTNVISQGENLRLRLSVARAVQNDARVKSLPFKMTDDEIASFTKIPTTSAGYGSKATERAKKIRANMAKALNMRDELIVMTYDTINPIKKSIGKAIRNTKDEDLKSALRQLRMDLEESVNKATPVYGDIDNILGYLDDDAQQFMRKLTSNNAKIITTRDLSKLSDAAIEELSRQLPGYEKITTFWADVAASYLKSTGRSSIGWRSIDGEITYYRFPKSTDHVVRRTLPDGSDIETRMTYYDDSIADIRKARQAYGVLGNFGNDSFITRAVGQRATIYDGFFDNIADLPQMRDDVLRAVAETVDSGQPELNLKFLLEQGWPRSEYDRFVDILEGLTGNATGQDVLDTIANTYIVD